MTRESESALTSFQVEVAQLFFRLPGARGFLLAGGAALTASGLTARPTQDLDLFTAPGLGDVAAAADELEAACRESGWEASRPRNGAGFVRMVIQSADDAVVVDLAVDAAPERPAVVTIAGPTLDPDDLAGRKVVALFDRAEARDFADVFVLARRYALARLLELAAETDRGFDTAVFVVMLDSLRRFEDDEIPVESANELRDFFAGWSRRLREQEGNS